MMRKAVFTVLQELRSFGRMYFCEGAQTFQVKSTSHLRIFLLTLAAFESCVLTCNPMVAR